MYFNFGFLWFRLFRISRPRVMETEWESEGEWRFSKGESRKESEDAPRKWAGNWNGEQWNSIKSKSAKLRSFSSFRPLADHSPFRLAVDTVRWVLLSIKWILVPLNRSMVRLWPDSEPLPLQQYNNESLSDCLMFQFPPKTVPSYLVQSSPVTGHQTAVMESLWFSQLTKKPQRAVALKAFRGKI